MEGALGRLNRVLSEHNEGMSAGRERGGIPALPRETWWIRPQPDDPRFDVLAKRHGHISPIDYPRLVDIGDELEAVIAFNVSIGSFIIPGQAIARVWGTDPRASPIC